MSQAFTDHWTSADAFTSCHTSFSFFLAKRMAREFMSYSPPPPNYLDSLVDSGEGDNMPPPPMPPYPMMPGGGPDMPGRPNMPPLQGNSDR